MKNHSEVLKNNKRINIYGNQATINRAVKLIENLDLNGDETSDRLTIQKCIDDNKIGATILYEGNTIYSFNKILKEYRKLQKEDSLEFLTKDMYDFFMNACGDIAHYDISGYRYYYSNSFRKLESEFLSKSHINTRFSDIDRIFKKLKIGKYYSGLEIEDLNKLSKRQLKELIEKCNWNVIEKEKDWELQVKFKEKQMFVFLLEVESRNVSTIIYGLINYAKKFNVDEYANDIIKSFNKGATIPVQEIVASSNLIKNKLNELVDNLLYKCKVTIELMNDYTNEVEEEIER